MTLRRKVTLGLLVLLVLLTGTGGYALYTVQRLDAASRTTQRANFYSIELGHQMLRALDTLAAYPPPAVQARRATADFQRALTRESGNITEAGEREVVDSLTALLAAIERGQHSPGEREASSRADDFRLAQLRQGTHRMMALNVAAFNRREARASAVATEAHALLSIGVSVAVLLALMLVWSVPAAAVAPLQLLQAAIRHATDHDFQQSIPVETHDEFGEVARDFNLLLSQLQAFRTSSLADLLTERNRIVSIINTLDEGLLLIDQSRRVLLVNPVAAGLLGSKPEELIGQEVGALAARNDLLRELMQPPGAGATADSPLLTIVPPEGGPAAYYRVVKQELVSFNPARDQLEFVGTIVALRNVSEFKQLDQVKSNFLATVSHELKTPLASILLSLKLLDDERVSADERRQVIAATRQETQRLQRLVAELLDVARLESGNIPLAAQPTAVADIVQFATQPIGAQLREKQLRLTAFLAPGLPAVRADVEKASWVLLNLLVNAIRYSPAGEEIRVDAMPHGAGFVQFSVSDHGPGIAAENHERIFQRFVRLPDQAQYAGGSGLGLSIAREFIQALGGRLWVESELGAGSTFRFTLPVAG